MMLNNDKCTEKLIREKAKQLFFVLGHLNAGSQEIADYAGVNRTLVNYYFRSKSNLFKQVHNEVLGGLKVKLKEIYISKQDLESKVDELIDCLIQFHEQYPFMEIFNIQDINDVNRSEEAIFQPISSPELKHFTREVEIAMEQGLVPKYNPIDFVLNLFSLVSFPRIMKPLFIKVLDMDPAEYANILNARKAVIKSVLFNKQP